MPVLDRRNQAKGGSQSTPLPHLSVMTYWSRQVLIVYYSMYGHIQKMAHKVQEGVVASGCEASLYQVKETIPDEILVKAGAAPKDPNVRETLFSNFGSTPTNEQRQKPKLGAHCHPQRPRGS